MMPAARWVVALTLAIAVRPLAAQQWATFVDETAGRLVADPALAGADPEEKDYAWGDLDNDGDLDLVVVRKLPFSTADGRRNLLLMNEGIGDGHAVNGVLVDRTEQYMTAATGEGLGFLDETNDRDVAVVDVNGDGWLDVVTGTAYGLGLPKWMSHSRVYVNLGAVEGAWLGMRYEEARIPQLVEAPNTCAVVAGDVTGDGWPDLYYVTYASTTLEDHLLVNDGTGHFADESALRLTPEMLASSFGTAGAFADMNGDGLPDIVKSENGPVKIIYNGGDGYFDQLELVSLGAHYHVTVGELNNDGKLDMVISDDFVDRYQLNVGNGGDGLANFADHTFSFSGGENDDGFASNSLIVDLNRDGFDDVIIADVDVASLGCDRRAHVYRNLGDLPDVTLQEQVSGETVVGIPMDMLTGTHDVAAMDLNGDEWLDLVIGRCTGTQVWMSVPPFGVVFSYPAGLPIFLPPDELFPIEVRIEPVGDSVIDPQSARMVVSVDGGGPVEIVLEPQGQDVYAGVLPAAACAGEVSFHFSAELDTGETFTDPPAAPASAYAAQSALGTELLLRDEIEDDVSGWTIIDDGAPGDTGLWEQAEPVPTFFNQQIAAPEEDATDVHEAVMCFVTLNGDPDEPSAAVSDVDGGPVRLVSPALDLEGTIATVSYARWFFSDGASDHVPDELTVDLSPDDGQTWVPVPEHTTGGTNGVWEVVSIPVGDYIEPTGAVRVRFSTSDAPNDSVTEAGIDDFQVEVLSCVEPREPCPGDLTGDGLIDVQDLVELILDFGCADPPGPCPGDVDGSGVVDVQDLVALILAWGACG